MKTIFLVALISFNALAQDLPPCDASHVGLCQDQLNAPTVQCVRTEQVFEWQTHAEGAPCQAPVSDTPYSVAVTPGDVILFTGQCIEAREFVRREKINARNEGELAEAKKSLLVSAPVAIAIIAGVVLTSVGATIAVMKLTEKK